MDWMRATDRLFKCGITARDIADEAGVKPDTIRHWRVDSLSSGHRSPPNDWPEILVRVTRKRVSSLRECGTDLEALADELEGS